MRRSPFLYIDRIEVDVVPVRIRLAGRLDSTTAANLDEVVGELLADGTREIELCTDGLRVVDASAIGTLADVAMRWQAEDAASRSTKGADLKAAD